MERIQNFSVSPICTAAIPEAVDYDLFPFCRPSELQALTDIFFKGNMQIVGFIRVKGNMDFVQGRGGKEQILMLAKERSVCGEDNTKAIRIGKFQETLQLGMAQGLSHQVEIEIIRKRLQLRQKHGKRICVHSCRGPLGSGTKGTGQVALIGNLYVDFTESLHYSRGIPAFSQAATVSSSQILD